LYQNPEKKGGKTMKGIFSILTVLFMVFGLTVSAHADPFAYASARVGSFDTGTWNSVVGNSSASAYSGTQNGVASAEIYLASGFLSTYATSSKRLLIGLTKIVGP
jgi:hypothetical protein